MASHRWFPKLCGNLNLSRARPARSFRHPGRQVTTTRNKPRRLFRGPLTPSEAAQLGAVVQLTLSLPAARCALRSVPGVGYSCLGCAQSGCARTGGYGPPLTVVPTSLDGTPHKLQKSPTANSSSGLLSAVSRLPKKRSLCLWQETIETEAGNAGVCPSYMRQRCRIERP